MALLKKGRITVEEKEDSSLPSISVFFHYIYHYGIFIFVLNLIMLFITQIGIIIVLWFFAQWATESLGADFPYLLTSASIIAFCLLNFFLFAIFNSFGIRKASDKIFENLLKKMLKRPMSFYDSTPIGQIIARLVNDRTSLSMEMGLFLMFVFYGLVQLIIILGFTAVNSPVMIVIFIILLIVLWIFLKRAFIINTGIRKI